MALSPGRAPSSLTSPGTPARRCKYQVFLSFRGEDTRKGFVSNLYYGLELQGISTFMDDRELEGGAPISTELPKAIEDSYLALIVLSPNYASSSWCMDELTKIVQCMDSKDSFFPIFYDVDPSQVRHQLGNFAKAFNAHDKKFTSTKGTEKVKQWKVNLTKVANRKGWRLEKYKNERELIAEVVHCVWKKVQPTLKLIDSPNKFVGRTYALHQLSELLDLGENDVRFIGITGMGGIGKTTLAHIVFESISHRFDFHCFLEKVREVSAKNDTLVGLQNQLLSSIFKEKVEKIWDEHGGANFIKNCLWNKKVLLVLDDVDLLNQLQKLAGGKDWFGNGSRIIITTRNRRLLVQHDITLLYEVEGMSDGEALELFSLKTFKKDQPEKAFLELSEHFVKYAKGIPLVLHILGSSLYKRDRDAWNSVLDNLQNNPHPQVFDLLKISYDSLQAMEKRIFLDIACFHKGKDKERVIDILNRRFGNISSLIVIDTLIERSLLTMSDHIYLEMHDLIQEMGREIFDRESKEEPGNRTRIWRLDDLCYVLAANTGTRKVEAIVVNSPKLKEIQGSSKAFSNMDGLRLIELVNVMIIPSAPICLPHSLRIIYWSSYPSEFLRPSFHMHYLTELSMPKSKLVRLWDGRRDFPNLKIMDLSQSDKLTSTPDFTGMPKLEFLRFFWCPNLVDIHSSIAVLKKLKCLDLQFCKSIECLHSELEMDSLKTLYLEGCLKMKKVPEFSVQMKMLSVLDLDGTAIEQLPSSIENLVGLTSLNLSGTAIEQLPSSIENLIGLTFMNLSWTAIDQLPSSIENLVGLTFLNLNGTAIDQLPSSIENLVGLTSLHLSGCKRLCVAGGPLDRLRFLEKLNLSDCNLGEGAVPEDIGCLSSLKWLNLCGNDFVTLPASIQYLSKLDYLMLDGCKRLQELPPLPPPRRSSFSFLYVNVKNCTSLRRLIDPSRLSSKFANLYDFNLYPLNCVRLVEDEGWINYVLSKIVRWITKDEGFLHFDQGITDFTYPTSEIPEWFVNKSEEAGDWLGIAFCFVWASETPDGHLSVRIECSSGFVDPLFVYLDGHLGPEHVTMFYWPRDRCHEECPEAGETEFSFETSYYDAASGNMKVGVNMVKKWGARWVYKQDLEDLQLRLKVPKRTHESYGEEAGPSGSVAFSDDEEPNCKRQKEDWAVLDIESK